TWCGHGCTSRRPTTPTPSVPRTPMSWVTSVPPPPWSSWRGCWTPPGRGRSKPRRGCPKRRAPRRGAGRRAERHLGRIAQAVAHAHALGHAEHLVDAVRLDLEDRVGALGREQAHAAGFAPSGDDRLDGGHRAGIALAVGGGDLGAP